MVLLDVTLVEQVGSREKLEEIFGELEPQIVFTLICQTLRIIYNRSYNLRELDQYMELLGDFRNGHLLTKMPLIEYEKLFKLFLLKSNNSPLLRKEVKSVRAVRGNPLNEYLAELEEQGETKKYLSYVGVVRNPTALAGYVNWIWNLVKNGKLEQAR